MGVPTHRTTLRLASVLIVGALALSPVALSAQRSMQVPGRFTVWIPDLTAQDRGAERFGRDVATRLRAMTDDLGTHRSAPERVVDDALDRLRVDKDDLDCERARTVAREARVAVLVCGRVHRASQGDGFELTARFVTVETGETFEVPRFAASASDAEVAATRVFGTFQTLVEQQRRAQFCAEFALSEQWERALENCDQAIELSPTGIPSIYTRGMVHVELEQWNRALADFRRVLELDPAHGNALKAAGLASTRLGASDEALGYYQAFLELNPGDVHVRMNLAYEAATAGDPLSAMVLIEEGLAIDPVHADLLLQKAGYAMSAAERAFRESGNELSEASTRLYRESIDAYEKVLAARPDQAEVSHRRNVISAYQRLGDLELALVTTERALETWPEEALLWSVKADVLQRAGRLPEAIEALDRVGELDAEYPNVLIRQGSWLLEVGQDDRALAALRESVARGERSADDVANVFFVSGYRDGVQPESWSKAVARFRRALEFIESADVETKVNFWLGYALLKRGQALEAPQTLESARQTRPIFEEALRRLRAGSGYEQIERGQYQNLVDGATRFLEIQDAIIRRGGR